MAKENKVKMWVPKTFRDYCYELKAEDSNQTLTQILDRMAKKSKLKKERNVNWWKL